MLGGFFLKKKLSPNFVETNSPERCKKMNEEFNTAVFIWNFWENLVTKMQIFHVQKRYNLIFVSCRKKNLARGEKYSPSPLELYCRPPNPNYGGPKTLYISGRTEIELCVLEMSINEDSYNTMDLANPRHI